MIRAATRFEDLDAIGQETGIIAEVALGYDQDVGFHKFLKGPDGVGVEKKRRAES